MAARENHKKTKEKEKRRRRYRSALRIELKENLFH
jgi:hypothetical protein